MCGMSTFDMLPDIVRRFAYIFVPEADLTGSMDDGLHYENLMMMQYSYQLEINRFHSNLAM